VGSREVEDRYTMWVVEACRDDAAHCASLDTPEVRAVIERGIPLIAEFDGVKLERWAAWGRTRSVVPLRDSGCCQRFVSTPASLGHAQHRVASTVISAELG
jgi:hypothetical protein